MRFSFLGLLFALSALGLFIAGCNEPAQPTGADATATADDHDAQHEHAHGDDAHAEDEHADHDHEHEHEHPETLADAVAQIDQLCTQIKDAFAAGKDDDADDAVHEVGHLLEDAAKLLDDAKLKADAKDALKSAITDLFDAFNKIDEKLHGGEGSSYADEEEKIQSALKALRENVTKTE